MICIKIIFWFSWYIKLYFLKIFLVPEDGSEKNNEFLMHILKSRMNHFKKELWLKFILLLLFLVAYSTKFWYLLNNNFCRSWILKFLNFDYFQSQNSRRLDFLNCRASKLDVDIPKFWTLKISKHGFLFS